MSDKQSKPSVKSVVYDTSCNTMRVLCGLGTDLQLPWCNNGMSGSCNFVVSACKLTGDRLVSGAAWLWLWSCSRRSKAVGTYISTSMLLCRDVPCCSYCHAETLQSLPRLCCFICKSIPAEGQGEQTGRSLLQVPSLPELYCQIGHHTVL